MRSLFISVFFVFFLSQIAFSQSKAKYWSEGKLSWGDFTEGSYTSFKYLFDSRFSKEKIGDTLVIREDIVCFVDKTMLQISDDLKNDLTLRHFQILFDIGELQARAIEKERESKPAHISYQTIAALDDKFSLMISEFEIESNFGSNLEALEDWENRVNKVLNSSKNREIPVYRSNNFSYGMFIGGAYRRFSGGLRDNYGNGGQVTFGFEGSYKKSVFFINIGIGGSKAKVSNSSLPWNLNQRLDVAYATLSYGYSVIDAPKIRVSPHVGFGVLEFSEKSKGDDRVSIARAVPYIGLDADFKLKKTLSFIDGWAFGGREKRELFLRTSVGMSYASFSKLVEGNVVHCSVLIGMRGTQIKPIY